MTGLKDKFVDVLMDRQPVRAIGVAHALMRPFVDPAGFPVRLSHVSREFCNNYQSVLPQFRRNASQSGLRAPVELDRFPG